MGSCENMKQNNWIRLCYRSGDIDLRLRDPPPSSNIPEGPAFRLRIGANLRVITDMLTSPSVFGYPVQGNFSQHLNAIEFDHTPICKPSRSIFKSEVLSASAYAFAFQTMKTVPAYGFVPPPSGVKAHTLSCEIIMFLT